MFVIIVDYVKPLSEVDRHLEALLESDPFTREGVATYAILEFSPVMCDPGLSPLLSPSS